MRLFLSLVFVGLVSVTGCGSADTSPGAGGGAPSDGKLHPAANGVAIASTDACAQLNSAVAAKAQSITPFCAITTTTCPGGEALSCTTFDDGTVAGCVKYYDSATNCTDLRTFANGCDVACKQ